jgi:hypothetical protein
MGCGPIVDPEICKDKVIIVSTILFLILLGVLIFMIYHQS